MNSFPLSLYHHVYVLRLSLALLNLEENVNLSRNLQLLNMSRLFHFFIFDCRYVHRIDPHRVNVIKVKYSKCMNVYQF